MTDIVLKRREAIGYKDVEETYTRDEIRDMFPDPETDIPAALLVQLETAEVEIERLRKENKRLRAELDDARRSDLCNQGRDFGPLGPGVDRWKKY